MPSSDAARLRLLAPLDGLIVPLEAVPDPVFAQKMVGDGVSVDPTSSVLRAPCAGTVVQLHSAGHALTLAAAEGVEVLMHVGLDTVNLKGQGFHPRVVNGDQVIAGQPLIEFDADFVATHARSLLTQIVITTADRIGALHPATGHVVAGRDVILEVDVRPGSDAPAAAPATGVEATSGTVVVRNATGLHARPAAVLASAAKKFAADVRIRRGDVDANAKSVVGLLGLEVNHGDRVEFHARGRDAQAAVDALSALLAAGLGDETSAPGAASANAAVAAAAGVANRATRPLNPPVRATSSAVIDAPPGVLVGVAASPGLAVGNVHQIRREDIAVDEEPQGDATGEGRRLDAALAQGRAQLQALQTRLAVDADGGKAAIFAAHEELLDDPDLLALARLEMGKGRSAPFAWRAAFSTHADRLAGLSNELLAARANDLRDVGRRVLQLLTGADATGTRQIPANAILIAEDLSPSDTASLDRSRVLGFCTTGGGATSHVAILARALDIPAVAGIDPRALEVPDETPVVLDGGRGTLQLNPSVGEVARIHAIQERHVTRRRTDLGAASQPAVTRDGHRIEVVANIGGHAEAEQTISLGGEGVGLLRSEFLFMDRASAPTEEEQAETYTAIARTLGTSRPLIIRTLDVGGDKPLTYITMPREENPFLGERGIRLQLNRPDLLRTQLRAILRAASSGRVLVMFPMIARLSEFRAARAMLEAERIALGAPAVPVGIMVEVPSAAVLAEQFAREVDFFSIGTNDLTQYTLAMDRGNPKLAAQVDGLEPSVLRLIASTVGAAHQQGKWVGVCGGIAADPQAIPILIGLGVDELSVSVPILPTVKAQIRTLSRADCQQLADQALGADSAADVRALIPAEE